MISFSTITLTSSSRSHRYQKTRPSKTTRLRKEIEKKLIKDKSANICKTCVVPIWLIVSRYCPYQLIWPPTMKIFKAKNRKTISICTNLRPSKTKTQHTTNMKIVHRFPKNKTKKWVTDQVMLSKWPTKYWKISIKIIYRGNKRRNLKSKKCSYKSMALKMEVPLYLRKVRKKMRIWWVIIPLRSMEILRKIRSK